ncbi:MAG: DUF4845 domain-containing protein [Gammaproteobacteria bacterium]|nr:DUF4845 domain-containing protein [Gammaproteobacteria bacterium]
MINRSRQKGVSGVGWLVMASIFGFFLLTFFKVFPMYYESYKITGILNTIQEDPSIDVKSKRAIWDKMQKTFYIDNIDSIKAEHVKMSRKNSQTTISINYERRTPFVANLFLVGKFNQTIVIDR